MLMGTAMFCFHKGMVNLRQARVGTSVETIHESCLLTNVAYVVLYKLSEYKNRIFDNSQVTRGGLFHNTAIFEYSRLP